MTDVLLTVAEVSRQLKCNNEYVHKLRKSGILPFLKIGNYKVRKVSLDNFLEKYEGKDITDPYNIIDLEGRDNNEFCNKT